MEPHLFRHVSPSLVYSSEGHKPQLLVTLWFSTSALPVLEGPCLCYITKYTAVRCAAVSHGIVTVWKGWTVSYNLGPLFFYQMFKIFTATAAWAKIKLEFCFVFFTLFCWLLFSRSVTEMTAPSGKRKGLAFCQHAAHNFLAAEALLQSWRKLPLADTDYSFVSFFLFQRSHISFYGIHCRHAIVSWPFRGHGDTLQHLLV